MKDSITTSSAAFVAIYLGNVAPATILAAAFGAELRVATDASRDSLF